MTTKERLQAYLDLTETQEELVDLMLAVAPDVETYATERKMVKALALHGVAALVRIGGGVDALFAFSDGTTEVEHLTDMVAVKTALGY